MTDKPQLYTGQSLVLVERSRALLAEWEVERLREALTCIVGEHYLAELAPDPHDSALGDPAKSLREIGRIARAALDQLGK